MNNNNNYDLTDEQWERLQPLLPPEYTGKKGHPRKDNQTMMNGMLWMNHSGAQWRQIPKRYGPRQSVYARFAKWRDDGTWESIFSELNKEADISALSPTGLHGKTDGGCADQRNWAAAFDSAQRQFPKIKFYRVLGPSADGAGEEQPSDGGFCSGGPRPPYWG